MTSTRWMTGVFIAAALTAQAQADVKTKAVTYTHDGVTFKGHLAWDDATVGKRPGILVVHEWWGINEYAKKRAEQLAALGYVAFAADMYGDGKTTDNPKESGQWAGALRKDIKTWRGRAAASLKVLEDDDKVDAAKLASIGYCFGGSTSIMLAHTGANVKAVVSFHGALLVPEADQAKAIKAKILICHGADDAFIPEETIQKTPTRSITCSSRIPARSTASPYAAPTIAETRECATTRRPTSSRGSRCGSCSRSG